jgi:transcriptional regulator with XRE-family HTH domain
MKSQKQIGKNMKAAREKLHFTQAGIAEKVGINVNYYARIERGEKVPSLEVLKQLAKVLKLNAADILPL